MLLGAQERHSRRGLSPPFLLPPPLPGASSPYVHGCSSPSSPAPARAEPECRLALRTSGSRDKRRTQRGGAGSLLRRRSQIPQDSLSPSRGLEFEDMRRWPTDYGFVDALPAR